MYLRTLENMTIQSYQYTILTVGRVECEQLPTIFTTHTDARERRLRPLALSATRDHLLTDRNLASGAFNTDTGTVFKRRQQALDVQRDVTRHRNRSSVTVLCITKYIGPNKLESQAISR